MTIGKLARDVLGALTDVVRFTATVRSKEGVHGCANKGRSWVSGWWLRKWHQCGKQLFLWLKCMSDEGGAVLCLTWSVHAGLVRWGGEKAEKGVTQASQVRLIRKKLHAFCLKQSCRMYPMVL